MPVTLLSFLVAPPAGQARRAPRRALVPRRRAALIGVGLLLMGGLQPGDDWTALLPGFLLCGIGIGLTNPALATAAIGVVDPRRAGMASGINSTFRQVGIATGIAAWGAIFQHKVASDVRPGRRARRPARRPARQRLAAGRLRQLRRRPAHRQPGARAGRRAGVRPGPEPHPGPRGDPRARRRGALRPARTPGGLRPCARRRATAGRRTGSSLTSCHQGGARWVPAHLGGASLRIPPAGRRPRHAGPGDDRDGPGDRAAARLGRLGRRLAAAARGARRCTAAGRSPSTCPASARRRGWGRDRCCRSSTRSPPS